MLIRAKKSKRNKPDSESLLVTVDVSKNIHTGYFLCPDGKESTVFKFGNSRHGFEYLYQTGCSFAKSHGLSKIVVGYESTGSYGKPLAHFLLKRGVELVQVNPMHTKRVKELDGNSPNKTDLKDPRVIADIIKLGHALKVIIPEGAAAELRCLSTARERQSKDLTAHSNLLQDLIGTIFPEFFSVFKDITGVTARYILDKYPDPASLVKLGEKKLLKIMETKSRKRFGTLQANMLYQGACETIGVCEGKASVLLEIAQRMKMMEQGQEFLNDIEAKMESFLKEIPYASYILSIKGIGVITAAGLIGEVGDFRKYRTLPELIKVAGLDLYEVSSGKHTGQRRISKRGRPLMRKLLFFSALRLIKEGGIFHEKYQQHLSSGMVKMKAVIAIAKKLLGVIFALARNSVNFDMDYNTEKVELEIAA